MNPPGLYIFIIIVSLGLAYLMVRFFLYAWRGFTKKDIVIFAEYQEFDKRVTGFWAQVWAVSVMIFVGLVALVLVMALIWMVWQRQ